MYHGMLTVCKEAGYTSSDAVARLRGILRMRKIGHTGTLDPDAVGVLPMCLGNATRICELIADREKEYLAVMRLGVRTDTQDMSGTVLARMEDEELLFALCGGSGEPSGRKLENEEPSEGFFSKGTFPEGELSRERSAAPDEKGGGSQALEAAAARIRTAAERFTGQIDQIPPMYSAVKVNGKRLYDLARKGKTVERKARRITIYSLEIEKIELPLVTMRVCCSKGTYIRTLCEDIGNALGTGAAMQSLLRTRVGRFTLAKARTLDEIERIAKTEPEEALRALIRPVDSFFAELPAAVCSPDALRLLKNGNPLTDEELKLSSQGEEQPTPPTHRTMFHNELRLSPQGEEPKAESCPGAAAFSASAYPLPGVGPQEIVVRVYDEAGQFYGLYKKEKGNRRYTAYRMFLPEIL